MPTTGTVPLVQQIPGNLISAALWNGEFGNVGTLMDPIGVGGYSATTAQAQIQTNPFPGSVLSLATFLGGELERIRYMISLITGNTYWYQPPPTGNNLQSVALTGEVRALAHSTIPSGWLQLTGTSGSPQNVSRTTYAGLFAVLGTAWGTGDGTTTFGLPPVDRAIVGAGNLYTVGQIFGEATHLLTTGELPTMTHNVSDPGHTHGITDPAHHHTPAGSGNFISQNGSSNTIALNGGSSATANSNTTSNTTGVTINSGTTGISVSDTNGGGAHNNIQPSMGMTLIIKT